MNKIKGYTITAIAGIVNGRLTNADLGFVINQLLPDSRKILFPETSLFFALDGPRRNGKQFIPEVYEKGVRAFVVAGEDFDTGPFPGAAFIFVKDTLTALQDLAEFHRQKFSLPIIGITGSNGKTIVKEWLFQLLQQDHNIIRSP
ncbi:MAG: bifunctional UDP-N-acetylmuramoyl-tripeptide:D-alanyl-D-alanine ligase/alanine racemase, partial [Chitinophagaceae bacterium]